MIKKNPNKPTKKQNQKPRQNQKPKQKQTRKKHPTTNLIL